MKQFTIIKKGLLLALCVLLGGVNVWGQDTQVLFHESFGDNASSARAWDDSYSKKTGIEAVFSELSNYAVTNAKQGKNTTGKTLSGLNQTSTSADASIIIGPLNTSNCSNMELSYYWKAASVKGTYTTAAYYSTSSDGEYTLIGNGTNGATSFVLQKFSMPVEAQVNTLYLKILWKTSNTSAIIDEVDLSGVYTSDPNTPIKPSAPTFSLAEGTFWSNQTLELTSTVEGGTIYYTTDGSDPTTSETATAYSTALTLSETTTIKACTKDGEGNYSNVVSRIYTFVPSIANTKETALTTSKAIALIDNTSSGQLAAEDQKVYVKGIISKVDSYNSSYKSITYWLDDNAFEVYSGKGLDNADFSAKTDIEVGATVIVYGNIKKYGTTYEFDKNNYLVEYTAPAPKTLTSVAISGDSYRTTYEEGETFDRSALILTATYDDGSTQDVTSSATWTVSPETLTTGTTEVIVTATYNEKTATKTIPVTVTKVLPKVTLDLSKNETSTATTEKIEWVRDEFTINSIQAKGKTAANNYYPGTEGKTYTSTRFYADNSFNVVPAPFVSIKKITYTATSGNYATALANSTWINATATANNSTVTIIPESGTKPICATIGATTGATSIEVSYETVDEANIILVAQDGEFFYATFSYNKAVEFRDAEVYTVDVEGTKLVLNEVTSKQVPANTGVLIKSNFSPVFARTIENTSEITSTNRLVASSVAMTGDNKYYKLAYGDWENKTDLGFYWGAEDGAAFTAKAGGAYLAVPAEASAEVKGFVFGGDIETAIEGVEAEAANAEIFDLSGRKVSKAVKGLYIINGKKVVK